MTNNFKLFFERRERNPLRKQRLRDSGQISSIDYVEQEKYNLEPEEQAKLDRMVELDVPEELITKFRNAKVAEKEKRLRQDYLRTKINKKQLWFKKYGISVYIDQYVEDPLKFEQDDYNSYILPKVLGAFIRRYKDIIPIRKFNIVITDNTKNPVFTSGKKSDEEAAIGIYQDRIIYLNKYNIDDLNLLVHEYAHFIADAVPNETYPMLVEEYKKMLESFFGRKTTRTSLKGGRNELLRAQVAKKMGLPSEYSATDPDEWFAELIQHWKRLPNNSRTYKFKSILKKIIGRL
jgi:hypothetical protein